MGKLVYAIEVPNKSLFLKKVNNAGGYSEIILTDTFNVNKVWLFSDKTVAEQFKSNLALTDWMVVTEHEIG